MNLRPTMVFGGIAVLSSLANSQDPWPMERQDRFGTARALSGPDLSRLTTPWVFRRLATGALSSAGAAIRADGVGFFDNWQQSTFYKIDTRTGGLLASFVGPGFLTTFPAFGTSDRVYTVHDSTSGRIIALRQSDLTQAWFRTVGSISNNDYERSSPIIGPDGSVILPSRNGHVVRYDAVTGATIWDTVTSASYRSVCFTRDDVNVIVSNGPNVTAINFLTGAIAWTRNLGSTVGAPGCAPDGSVIVGTSGGTVFALDPILGVNRWVAPALGPVSGAPAFGTAGQVYVCSTNQKVFALDGSSGTTNWSFATQSQFLNGPVVGHDDSVYLINVNGEIFKLRQDGSQIWSVDLPCNTRGNFSIDPEGTIYVGLSDGLNGLLIVKQVLDDHSPESTLLVRGKNVSGGLPELQSVDGQYFVANPGLVTSQNEFPIQLNCSTTLASDKLDRLTINVTTSVDSPGLIQVISLYNVTIGNYEIVDVRSAPLVDTTTSVNINSPSRFVDAFQKNSTVKISYFPSTFVPTSVWKAKIDAVKWLATPTFAIP